MDKLVSIVLPTYNGERYLEESIHSILNQTYKNWELLILDDCSKDATPSIARKFEQVDPRIHYYRNNTNLRLPGNLNRGFSLAKGEYLTWTSDDNNYHPTAIEKMCHAIEDNQAKFVFASCRIIDENNQEIEYIMVNATSKKRIIGQDTVGACFMYTRDVYENVGEYDPECILVEDYDYWQRIFHYTDKVSVIEEILYDYRMHAGALTSTMSKIEHAQRLENVLLKNRPGFGKISLEQNFYYYRGLSACRKKRGEKDIYVLKFRILWLYYQIFHRLPNKLRRMLDK